MPLKARARVVFVIAGALCLFHLVLANRYGIFRDEMYYVACGDHLDFGYVDHPPMVALMAKLAQLLFGHRLFALRVFPALCSAAVVVLGAELARTFGGDRFAQVFAAICVAVVPTYLVNGGFLSMNCLEQVLWPAAALLLARALLCQRPVERARAWIAFGVTCGLGILTKHSMLFWGAALTIGVVATSHRRVLLTKWPWIAVAIAALLAAPNVLWEIHHRWPTLEFMRNAQEKKMVPMPPHVFVGESILEMHPVLLPIWASGVGWLLVATRAREVRGFGVAFLAVAAIIVLGHGKPYYLAPAFVVPIAAGAVALEAWITRFFVRISISSAVVVLGAVFVPAVVPLLSPASLRAYLDRLGIHPASSEKHETPPLPQHFADQFGWEPMVQKVADAWSALTDEERAVAVIWGSNYGEAGAIDWFGPSRGLPRASSGHNNYFLWGPPVGRGAVLIGVGGDREDYLRAYDDVRQVDVTDAPWAMPYENHRPIWVCRRPKVDLATIWAQTKKFI